MNQQILGTINKRVDVGVDKSNDTVFIHASSNCINFTSEEMDCLLSVLTIINSVTFDDALDFLSKHHIHLWIPATPPAEIRII
jgi:hypothetical protein